MKEYTDAELEVIVLELKQVIDTDLLWDLRDERGDIKVKERRQDKLKKLIVKFLRDKPHHGRSTDHVLHHMTKRGYDPRIVSMAVAELIKEERVKSKSGSFGGHNHERDMWLVYGR